MAAFKKSSESVLFSVKSTTWQPMLVLRNHVSGRNNGKNKTSISICHNFCLIQRCIRLLNR